MRRLLASTVLALMLTSPVSAAEPPRIVVDNSTLSVPPEQSPFIQSDRTMVPLRAIFEALGAAVEWNQADRTVSATKEGTTVVLQIGSSVAGVNGNPVRLDQPAMLVESRTFVPIRFVSEALGAKVSWVEASRSIAITTRPVESGAPLAFAGATGDLERISHTAGQPLTASGDSIFFLDLQSGAVEGWTIPGARRESVGYGASADGRFVIARSTHTGWLVDRITGQTHKWDRRQHDLITTSATHLLFEETRQQETVVASYDPRNGSLTGHLTGTGRFAVVRTSDMTTATQFALPNDSGLLTPADHALFAPDGQKLVISGNEVRMVDLSTGASEQVPVGKGRLMAVKGGTEFVGFHEHPKGQQVRRINWRGEILADATIEAKWINVSPDGEWVAWEVVMANFTPTVFYARLSEAHNPARALGASMCYGSVGRSGNRWMGDGLLVYTKEGMRVISRDGAVSPVAGLGAEKWGDIVPDFSQGNRLGYRDWNANGYTLGARDKSGDLLSSVTFRSPDGVLLPHRSFPLWGSGDDELRFTVRTHYGTGGACGDYAMPLPVKVQKPGAFDSYLKLEVTGTGDCLNVRTQPSRSSAAVTCLPDGTWLDLGNNAYWESLPQFVHNEEGQWFQLNTSGGVQGWVLVSSGYLKYID